MSADSQRLKSALRRIVLESPELRELLGDSDNRGDQPGSAGVGTSEAEESRLCCDGSTSDNANPGTDERDPDADGAGQDGLDPDDPADLTSGDGTLSGVTDCATGEPVCFDGSGFIPPEGWDEPNLPPVDDLYVEGTYWTASDVTGSYVGASPEQIGQARYGSNNGAPLCYNLRTNGCYQVFWYNPSFSGTQCNVSGIEICPSDCGGSTEDYCTEVPRTDDIWPSDGCTNLAIKGGKIVGSKYDPENSAGDYSAPRDEIQLCSGADQIGLKPAANGGWKTINASTNSGYLWDSQGNKIAHIDGNEYSDPDV